MATYVNDLRLKEIATGDESGTWGTSTNTNLELIGEALGFGTEAITTNADTHTTTVADGSTDPGRAMYLKYTGTLDSACTITIAPNTMSRMHFIENGTSGSQNIIISQGSGANVTIPAGDVKAVYLDGAGSGAAVVDAFASLNVVDLKVEDDLTVTDDVSIGGALTLTGNGDFNGDLDVDGTTNLDVVDIDGAVDMASTLQVDGAITSSAGATITVADNSDNLTLTSTDADANVGPNLLLYRNSGSPANNDALGSLSFTGRNDNSQDVEYALVKSFIDDVTDGTEDGILIFSGMSNGSVIEQLRLSYQETVFNEGSVDLDFRVESNGNANMLFVDGGNDRVGIGTASPRGVLDLGSGSGDGSLDNTPSNYQLILEAAQSTTGDIGRNIAFVNSTNDVSAAINSVDGGAGLTQDLMFAVAASGTLSEVMRLDAAGNVGIGTTSPSAPLHVDGAGMGDVYTGRIENTTTDTDHYNVVRFIQGASGSATGMIGTGGSATSNVTFRNNFVVGTQTSNALVLATNDTEKMRITSTGAVLFGPGSANTSSYLNAAAFVPQSTNNPFLYFNTDYSGGTITKLSFARNGSSVGSITSTASATAYNTSSDYRLKENVVEIDGAIDRVKLLQPKRFNFIVAPEDTVDGFIAHEVQDIVPEAITGVKDEMQEEEYEVTPAVLDEDGSVVTEAVMGTREVPKYQGIDQSKLVPLLTKAIQEQQTIIEDLKTRIETLEG